MERINYMPTVGVYIRNFYDWDQIVFCHFPLRNCYNYIPSISMF